jgi:hypothetical protein
MPRYHAHDTNRGLNFANGFGINISHLHMECIAHDTLSVG